MKELGAETWGGEKWMIYQELRMHGQPKKKKKRCNQLIDPEKDIEEEIEARTRLKIRELSGLGIWFAWIQKNQLNMHKLENTWI